MTAMPEVSAAVETAFHLAGVVPVFLPSVNKEAWLVNSVRVEGKELLVVTLG